MGIQAQSILALALLTSNGLHHLKSQQVVGVYSYVYNPLLLRFLTLLLHDYVNGHDDDVLYDLCGRDHSNDRVNAYYFPLSCFNNSSIQFESNFPERIISISFLYGAI